MITGAAKIAGIMGWPVSHSRSPRLHGYWLTEYAIDGAYLPLPVRPEDLGAALRVLPKLGFRGVNLTVPHKEAALAHLDRIDPVARLIGAVNTVTIEADGTLTGFNTDIEGFKEALLASGARPDAGRTAVVLGAGGAARGVVAALAGLGLRSLVVANRNRARAEALTRDLAPLGPALRPVSWERRAEALAGAGLLVNTTSLGMAGNPALEIDLSFLPKDALVADIVYTPLETPLLKAARACGLAAVDGLGMLLYQARPSFRAWFGVDPAVTPALRAHVLG